MVENVMKRKPSSIDSLISRAGDITRDKLQPGYNPWMELALEQARQQADQSGLMPDEGYFPSLEERKKINQEIIRNLLK